MQRIRAIQDEMNKALDNLTTELPKQILALNKALDSIENLKFLVIMELQLNILLMMMDIL